MTNQRITPSLWSHVDVPAQRLSRACLPSLRMSSTSPAGARSPRHGSRDPSGQGDRMRRPATRDCRIAASASSEACRTTRHPATTTPATTVTPRTSAACAGSGVRGVSAYHAAARTIRPAFGHNDGCARPGRDPPHRSRT